MFHSLVDQLSQLLTRCRRAVTRTPAHTATPPPASAHTAGNTTDEIDFGSQRVRRDEKQELVHSVFARVAASYDLMNDVMSFGIHRLWKWRLVRDLAPAHNTKHLDVAGGTGDVAFRVLHAAKAAHKTSPSSSQSAYDASHQVVVFDINANMLRVGLDRARAQCIPVTDLVTPTDSDVASHRTDPKGLYDRAGALAFVEGNAEKLPFPDDSFDSYTIVFGLRNVTDRMAALREARRVLKPGGRYMCMEFSTVTIPILDRIYEAYNRLVIPTLGAIIANDRESYAYLVESIERMPAQEELARMMREAGFQAVTYQNITAGIVAIHQGFKQM